MKLQRYQLQLSFEASTTASLDSSQHKNVLAKNILANVHLCGFLKNTLLLTGLGTHLETMLAPHGVEQGERAGKRKEKEEEEKNAHGT
jgi:hypothetical protein